MSALSSAHSFANLPNRDLIKVTVYNYEYTWNHSHSLGSSEFTLKLCTLTKTTFSLSIYTLNTRTLWVAHSQENSQQTYSGKGAPWFSLKMKLIN
jgi:hypothetical protein